MTVPEDDRLRLVPTPHDKVHPCGQLIEMRRWRSWSTGKWHAGILVAPLLVVLCGNFIGIGKGLVWVDYDEVGSGYPCVWVVRTETSVEDGKDGVISGIYGGGSGGENEVYEVAGRDGV